jgi:hypothetical protein
MTENRTHAFCTLRVLHNKPTSGRCKVSIKMVWDVRIARFNCRNDSNLQILGAEPRFADANSGTGMARAAIPLRQLTSAFVGIDQTLPRCIVDTKWRWAFKKVPDSKLVVGQESLTGFSGSFLLCQAYLFHAFGNLVASEETPSFIVDVNVHLVCNWKRKK